jgi:hypothetical protein
MTTGQIVVKCKVVGKNDSSGEVVFSDAPFNFYLTNPLTSEVIEEGHPMKGKSLKNKIVALPSGKGSSVVQVDGLYQLSMHRNAPSGLVILNPEPTIVSAAFVADVTLATGIDRDTYDLLRNAKFVELSVKDSEIIIKG